MALSVPHSARQFLLVQLRPNEENVVSEAAQDIPVRALQGRTTDHCAWCAGQFPADASQKWEPILVGERLTRPHLGNVARWMMFVAFDESPAKRASESLGER